MIPMLTIDPKRMMIGNAMIDINCVEHNESVKFWIISRIKSMNLYYLFL